MKRTTDKRGKPAEAIARLIEAKRASLFDSYNLPPAERERAEILFAEMRRVGGECRTLDEFNDRFHHHTLARELYLLMADNGMYVRPEAVPPLTFPAHAAARVTAAAPPAEKAASAQPRRGGRLRQWIRKLVKFQSH